MTANVGARNVDLCRDTAEPIVLPVGLRRHQHRTAEANALNTSMHLYRTSVGRNRLGGVLR